MIIPDINLLVYVHNDQSLNHRAAMRWWEGLLNGTESIGLPWAVSTGFVRVITNSAVMAPLSALEAVDYVRHWLRHPRIAPINPGPDYMNYFRQNIRAVGIGQNLVPDAHIAALAMENEAELHSSDLDFRRFPGLRWINPLRSEDGEAL